MTDDIEDLREQTRGTDRIETEVGDTGGGDAADAATEVTVDESAGSEGGDDAPAIDVTPSTELEGAVATSIRHARTGIAPRSYSGDDPVHGGLFEALRERPEDAERVAEALAAAAGEEPPERVDKATLVDLAVAAGLRSAAPSIEDVVEEHRR